MTKLIRPDARRLPNGRTIAQQRDLDAARAKRIGAKRTASMNERTARALNDSGVFAPWVVKA